jgi:cupin 2 domain-containing protein
MRKIQPSNLFGDIPESDAELFHTLWRSPQVRIERIVSRGHRSPQGFWYDQAWDEWVLLLKGRAGLVVEGEAGEIVLAPGDCLLLPSGLKHRVAWTDADGETIWLAVHAGMIEDETPR